MSSETHDLAFATKTTLINVHNGGKLVFHQTQYKESAFKTFVTGLSGEHVIYTLQEQAIQILFGRCTLSTIKPQQGGGEKLEALPPGPNGAMIATTNSTLKFKVTEAPCILIFTPKNDPTQPGGKDDLPVVR